MASLVGQNLENLNRGVLVAYAQDLEERLATVGAALERSQAVAMDAIAMEKILRPTTDIAAMHLSIQALDGLLRYQEPGDPHAGIGIFCEYFSPVISQINEQRGYTQQPQQQYQQPQERRYEWAGGNPNKRGGRASFPAQPEMGTQGGGVDLASIPPALRYQYVDQML